METITVSHTYQITYWVTEDICVTKCGKYINAKKGIELQKVLNGTKTAIYINRRLVNLENLKPIKREIQCPF